MYEQFGRSVFEMEGEALLQACNGFEAKALTRSGKIFMFFG